MTAPTAVVPRHAPLVLRHPKVIDPIDLLRQVKSDELIRHQALRASPPKRFQAPNRLTRVAAQIIAGAVWHYELVVHPVRTAETLFPQQAGHVQLLPGVGRRGHVPAPALRSHVGYQRLRRLTAVRGSICRRFRTVTPETPTPPTSRSSRTGFAAI
jgi:hypothetical protein